MQVVIKYRKALHFYYSAWQLLCLISCQPFGKKGNLNAYDHKQRGLPDRKPPA